MDFDICFSFPLAFSFLVAFAIIIITLTSERHSKSRPAYTSAIPVVEIVKALEETCPPSCQNKWKLYPFDHGCCRCWNQSVTIPLLQNEVHLYGSSMAVHSSSSNICSLVADVSRWPEWNPFFTSQYIVKPFQDKTLRRDHFMEAEQVISIVKETDKIQSHVIMYRFHDFSENKVGWILFWNPKKLEFLYFLVQPIKNKSDNPVCLLTHLMGTQSKLHESSISLVSQRLRNIQDMLSFSSLYLVPSNFMSSLDTNSKATSSENKSKSPDKYNADGCFLLSSVRARKRDVLNTVFILVPFIHSVFDFWKISVEFKLAAKNMESASSQKKHPLALKPKEKISDNKKVLCPLRRAVSDVAVKSKILTDINKNVSGSSKDLSAEKGNDKSGSKNMLAENTEQSSDVTKEDPETKHCESQKNKMLSSSKFRSLSETAINNLKTSQLPEKSGSSVNGHEGACKLDNINENVEDNLLAIDEQDSKEMFQSSISDYEVVEDYEFTENRMAGFMTQGNYGAAELMTEVLIASQYFQDMCDGNYQSIGGWVFHSYFKGLCVLRKTTCNKFLTISSFLCQTDVPVSPEDVWKLVKCPQFRFICDESVKSVEVLEKISNSQKLVHTYHEIPGFLKKELIDFCLLQTEREEVDQFYSCFCSVEFDKCPFMKSVTRGTLKPSGWIVERSKEDSNRSLVTYVMQGLISSPDSLFIQELSTMVPHSVHNLKNYIISKPM